jgi:hypothetical protein
MQMFFNRLKNRMGIQFDVAHHFGKHVPLDLGEGEKQMLVCQ